MAGAHAGEGLAGTELIAAVLAQVKLTWVRQLNRHFFNAEAQRERRSAENGFHRAGYVTVSPFLCAFALKCGFKE